MAVDVRNIVVGAANVFWSASTTTTGGRPAEPTWNSASSAAVSLRGSTSWVEAGLTTEGVDISYEPNYGEVMVDQLLDVAKIFKQSLKVTAKTTLSEATLANLEVAFGNENTVSYASVSSVVMSLPAGALGTEPVERSLIFVSQSSPGATQTGWGTASTSVANNNTERVYFARRVVSMDTVAHSMKRDAATVFPVTFRLLPDTATANAGSEYGKIIDRIYTGPAYIG